MSVDELKTEFDVFLSHSSIDKPWVIKLKEDLKRYGVSVWLDKDEIQPGALFAKALEDALENCKTVALVVSPEAVQSGWVKEEYYRALSLSQASEVSVHIIPVILRDAELPGFIKSRNWVDFRNKTLYSDSVWKLVWGITGQQPAEVLALSGPDIHPVTTPSVATPENATLWRLAYAFLRLEQLPSGGWARSLPKWYQTLKGDTEEGRSRAFELRKVGGMNLACIAVLNYTRSLCNVLGKKPEEYLNEQNPTGLKLFLNELDQIERRNEVGQRAARYIQGRINTEGAIPDQWERNPDTDVHHTLLGIIVLLLVYFLSARRCDPTFFESIQAMCRYLNERGRHVRLSGSSARRYEIYCALKFLEHLLKYEFFKTEDPDVGEALAKLPDVLADIRSQVSAGGVSYTYPKVKSNASSFLLNLAFFWNISGSELLETNPNFTKLPLSLIDTDADKLVQCTLGEKMVGPDWGHTAEYWWANTRCGESAAGSIQRALQTLYANLTNSSVFSLTHGVSFSYALGICNPPTPKALHELDEQVNNVLNLGATERNMLSLILWIYKQEHADLPLLYQDLDKDRSTLEAFRLGHGLYPTINKIKNLFVNKLQPGFYIPTKVQEEPYKQWQQEVKKSIADTRKFFEDDLSEHNTSANEQRLPDKKWFHLFNYLEDKAARLDDWIFDIGCGSGAHAIHQFLPQGYRVHFYDYSKRILDELKSRLDEENFSESQYQLYRGEIEKLPDLYEDAAPALKTTYRMIFADGVLFHISKELMPKILGCFYKMLSKDGLFFANFKVNDHTLIGIDGRRFEYYASHDEIQRMIEDAGFQVEEMTLTHKITSMYNNPYPTQWAHFISGKRQDD